MIDHSTQTIRPLPVGAIGPGTQSTGDDGAELEYLAMPSAMQTYRPPPLPEPEEVADCAAGLALLGSLHLLLSGYRVGAMPQVIDLAGLEARNRQLVLETLGEGEVSIRSTGAGPRSEQSYPATEPTAQPSGQSGSREVAASASVETGPRAEAVSLQAADSNQPAAGSAQRASERTAQETRLAGVWRVTERDAEGTLQRDVLEVCSVPGFVRFATFAKASACIDADGLSATELMNAPGVIAELNAALTEREDRGEPVIVNLTLLPQTEADLACLEERLGLGPVSILSRGYGNCRITATAIRDLWWVQYFNSDDRLILNTLELTEVPAAALAAQEDIDDSAERLDEILQALK
ncbi:hydrogenase expression/formation protein [Lamprobacter modestohalophilus]|uniref:hydrogenase expression/formation protein n=1 Tax=Lamprobacter modestohalophilus TaxID=1064514 RepID=UPI002ADEF408|nr:hydrogenase expression/formation protein [Lamprobacter modestohalophilus]MEA1051565.1 hydrogenase expression/formation protein [Lamprobacter modestohalophilus]